MANDKQAKREHVWVAKNDYGITTYRCGCGAVKIAGFVYVPRKRKS